MGTSCICLWAFPRRRIWQLSHRIPSTENQALRGTERADKVAELMWQGPPGVLAYDGDEVVGWAEVHPRADIAFAKSRYPVDNRGQKVESTMAYVGTQALFEKAGFTQAADTDSVINGLPRVLMRLDLR